MILDFHTHTFPSAIAERAVAKLSATSHSAPFSDGTTTGLVSSMEKAGISRSVILPVATNPEKLSHLNDVTLRENDPETLLYFGAVHPTAPDALSELERLREGGIRGVKMHPVYQGENIDSPSSLAILKRAAELGLLVVIHAGDDIGFPGADQSSPQRLARAVSSCGGDHLILAHMGGWKKWREAARLLTQSVVYLDTSFSLGQITPVDDHYTPEELSLLGEDQFCEMVSLFTPDRILFGSDSPWTDQTKSVEAILHLPLKKEDKEKILGLNALRLLEKE